MPEGPEVSYTAKYIHDKYNNSILEKVNILTGRYAKHGPPTNFDDFEKDLPMKLITVKKKEKYYSFILTMIGV